VSQDDREAPGRPAHRRSFVNVAGGFTPSLPSSSPGDFTLTDLVIFSGMSLP
jgi:hypothetical protein